VACFASRGFAGTTTREVASRAGITEAGLYRHFDSKEALYAAIIDAKMQAPDLLAGLAEAARRGDDRAVLGGLAEGMLERGLGDPEFVRILFFSALEGHALAEPFFEARTRRLRDFLSAYFARRVEEGGFRPIDPLLAAGAFIGMVFDHVNVAVVFRRVEPRARSPRELATGLVDLFLAGVHPGAEDRP
jgi:AcrR family transcriptional regulator